MNLWLLFLLAVFVLFLAMETIGWVWDGIPGTLSYYVRASTKRQPILICLFGLGIGLLIMHFWGQGWCG